MPLEPPPRETTKFGFLWVEWLFRLYLHVKDLTTTTYNGALVYSSGSVSIANSSNVTLSFDSEEYDTDSYHDNVTNNGRLTVPSEVDKVVIDFSVQFAANSTGIRQVSLRKNGASTFKGRVFAHETSPDATYGATLKGSTAALEVNSGDYFELVIFQTSGGNLNVLGGNEATWFGIRKAD